MRWLDRLLDRLFREDARDRAAAMEAVRRYGSTDWSQYRSLDEMDVVQPADPDLEFMCPNCVTPWKCNGPHTEAVSASQALMGEGFPNPYDLEAKPVTVRRGRTYEDPVEGM